MPHLQQCEIKKRTAHYPFLYLYLHFLLLIMTIINRECVPLHIIN